MMMMIYVEVMGFLFLVKVFRSVLDRWSGLDGQLDFLLSAVFDFRVNPSMRVD